MKSVSARNITLGSRLLVSPEKKALNPAIHRLTQRKSKTPFHTFQPKIDTPIII
jgi:hypothetical protein